MAVTSAVAVLNEAGLTAITNAITSQEPIQIASWEVGSLANAEVPLGATGALPAPIYSGGPSRVLLESENGLAVFNIVLDEAVGDFYVGNIALKVIDPVTKATVLLAVIMFPTTIYKQRSEANGGATGETGDYYLAKLVIKLSTMQAVAQITVGNTHFSVIPSVDTVDNLADPSATVYPHQILLNAPETGSPALIAKRSGDNLWWGFSLSWPVKSHMFGVISGGYQGDWYATDNRDVLFGGNFYMSSADYEDTIVGGVNWVGGTTINMINGGTWS